MTSKISHFSGNILNHFVATSKRSCNPQLALEKKLRTEEQHPEMSVNSALMSREIKPKEVFRQGAVMDCRTQQQVRVECDTSQILHESAFNNLVRMNKCIA